MAKTKLSTFLRSMVLVLFLVSWVSLKTIVKDGNFPVSTNGVKGKNKLKFLIPFTHSLNSADDESSRKNCLREVLLVIRDKGWNSLAANKYGCHTLLSLVMMMTIIIIIIIMLIKNL